MSQVTDLEETIQLCKKVPRCVPCVDWAHLYARNQGKIDFGKIFDALKPLKLKHLHTHFSCINFGPRGERNHLTLKYKKPDYQPLVKEILKRKPCDITLISESPALEQDALLVKKMFEKGGYKFR
jgi:deoxyribonuclease-4